MILCATYTCYYNLVSPVDVARERELDGDLFLWDMGEGLGFRPGVFDGVIRSVKSTLERVSNPVYCYYKRRFP